MNASTAGANVTGPGRMTLQDWQRVRKFIADLTDPEMYGHAVTAEVRRRALELAELFK